VGFNDLVAALKERPVSHLEQLILDRPPKTLSPSSCRENRRHEHGAELYEMHPETLFPPSLTFQQVKVTQ
jgi:hypothetical protein